MCEKNAKLELAKSYAELLKCSSSCSSFCSSLHSSYRMNMGQFHFKFSGTQIQPLDFELSKGKVNRWASEAFSSGNYKYVFLSMDHNSPHKQEKVILKIFMNTLFVKMYCLIQLYF